MFKKILVPLDGSDLAEAILPYVYDLATCTQAEVLVLSVETNPAFEFAFADPSVVGRIVQDLEAQVRTYVAGVEIRLRGMGVNVTTKVIEGPIAPTILQVAKDEHADVIAMSTHGRSGPARWVLGSVADRIVRESPVPVLLIRPSVRG